jgi:hypothetical protein
VLSLGPGDFFWRFLPCSQQSPERLPLPAAYELSDSAARLPAAAEALLSGARGPRAQRAEMLTQSKFVVSWGGHAWLGVLCAHTQHC